MSTFDASDQQPTTYSAAVVNLEGVALPDNSDEATPDIEEKISPDELQQKSFADFGVPEAFTEALDEEAHFTPSHPGAHASSRVEQARHHRSSQDRNW